MLTITMMLTIWCWCWFILWRLLLSKIRWNVSLVPVFQVYHHCRSLFRQQSDINSTSASAPLSIHELQYHSIANIIAAFVTIVAFSTSKYLTYKTSFQRTTTHEEMVLYPSISFCKKWTYDHFIDEQIRNENNSFPEIRDTIESEVWARKKVVHFLR